MKADEKKALFVKLIENDGFKKWKEDFHSLKGSEVETLRKYCKLYEYKTTKANSLGKTGNFYYMLANYVARAKK